MAQQQPLDATTKTMATNQHKPMIRYEHNLATGHYNLTTSLPDNTPGNQWGTCPTQWQPVPSIKPHHQPTTTKHPPSTAARPEEWVEHFS